MELAIVIIGALFGTGGIVAMYKARSDIKKINADSKKIEAEADVTLGGGWKILWETSRLEVNELRERLVIVEKSEENCKARLAKLENLANPDFEKKVAKLIEEEIKRMGGEVTSGRRTRISGS